MASKSKSAGKKGEDLACKFLKKDKYKILEKNFRCRQGEIDIIAEDRKGVLCFVEVKARSTEDFGLPIEAVTHFKQKRLLATAFIYLESKKIKSKDMRFDIVSVDLVNEETEILKNAFDVNYYQKHDDISVLKYAFYLKLVDFLIVLLSFTDDTFFDLISYYS